MIEKPLRWCGTLGVTLLAVCVAVAGDLSARNKRARLKDDPDEMRLDEVYRQAIAQADPQQRAVFEKEHAWWLLEREKLKQDPETYLAYVQQEIRYFAGTYEEP